MLKQTDQALRRISRESTALSISKDETLGRGDLQLIADVIRQAPHLETFALKNCNLSSDDMRLITRAILEHPSLGVLDFSGNAFTSLDFAIPLVGLEPIYDPQTFQTSYVGNPRIHALDLSGNSEAFEHGAAKSLLQASFSNDHMAVLRLPVDPWEVYGHSFGDALAKSRNLVSANFLIEKPTTFFIRDPLSVEAKKEMIDNQTSRNASEVQSASQRAETAEMISTDDVAALNIHLPAILYLGCRKWGRLQTLDLLTRFHDRALTMTGEKTELKKYLALIPEIAKTPPTTFAPMEATPSDLTGIVKALPEITRQSIRNEMATCRSNPSKCMDLGAETMRAVSKSSTTALTLMTSQPQLPDALPMLNAFIEKFGKVVQGLEGLAGQRIEMAMLGAGQEITRPQKKGFWSNLVNPDVLPQDLHDLAPGVEEAAVQLRNLVPAVQEIASGVENEIHLTQTVVDVFDKLKDYLQVYFETGHELAVEWGDEYRVKHPDMIEGDEPFYLKALNERVAFLKRAYERVGAHRGSHIMHGELLQRQSQQVLLLAEQNLPLLGATVEAFGRQLQTTRPGVKDAKGVLPAIRAIDAQSRQLRGALVDLDRAGGKRAEPRQ